VEVFQIASFEGHGTAEHGEKKDTERPDINKESLISFINNNLWS